jgi:hypothetical protein
MTIPLAAPAPPRRAALDLKPSNVIAECGRAKLIDLSVARAPGSGPPGHRARRIDELRPLPGELADPVAACLLPEPERRPGLDAVMRALEPLGQ